MPPKTKNREPVIVYLRREVKERLERRAREQDRTLSATASRIIEHELEDDDDPSADPTLL